MTNFKFKDQNDFWAKLSGVIAFIRCNSIFANTFLIDPYTTAPAKLDLYRLKKKKKKNSTLTTTFRLLKKPT